MAGKRHTREVIAAKLAKADEMAARGDTQQEISRALGVSVMTYHRWKKDREEQNAVEPTIQTDMRQTDMRMPTAAEFTRSSSFADLQVENERLRRLVTDLLLEKMALQEQLHETNNNITLRYRKP